MLPYLKKYAEFFIREIISEKGPKDVSALIDSGLYRCVEIPQGDRIKDGELSAARSDDPMCRTRYPFRTSSPYCPGDEIRIPRHPNATRTVRIVGGIGIVHAEICGVVDVHVDAVIASPQPTGLASLTRPILACSDAPFPAELVCRSCIRDIAINNGSRSVLLQKGKYAVASQRKQARNFIRPMKADCRSIGYV